MNAAPSVLIVDDNAINATLAHAHFGRAGWSRTVASDGTSALRAIAAGTFDLVLLDISMPDMSGVEVCAAIRADPRCQGVRVVAYTAHAMAEEHKALRAAGFDDILTKPVVRTAIGAMLLRMGFASPAQASEV